MSGEIPSHQPNSQEMGPNAMSDAAAMDIRTGQEALHDGARLLAGNIVRIAETNESGAVKEYLGDVLADTEKLVPAAERMAAFEFLAGEQRSEIRRGLVTSGEQMLDNLGNNSQKTRQELQQTAPAANRGIRMTVEAHEQEVGRHFRGQVDTHEAARGHEVAEQTARRGFGAVTKHVETVDAWARAQQQEAQKFDGEFKKGQAHERALTEASEVVKPHYEGEQKDLSRVIDEEVKEAAATKLQSAIAEAQAAGKSPEDAILELITQEPESVNPKVIGELRTFAEQYASFAVTGSRKVDGMTKESEQLMKRFAARGRDGYQYVRRVEEAMDLYRQQKRTLEDAVKGADTAIRQSANAVGTTDQELQRMRQKLAATKAGSRSAE
jgi:prefoldin subunit 5